MAPTPPTPTPDSDLGPERAPGRHGRARTLARRRSEGEPLTSYESRLLEAHMTACEQCHDWAAALPAAPDEASFAAERRAATGQEDRADDTVRGVEALGTAGGQATREGGSRESEGHSEVDAMGKKKRREVIGHTYGPTKARQIALYLVAVAVVIGVYFGGQYAIGKLDTAPAHDKAQAPWAQPGAPQAPPQRFQ